MNFPTIKNNFNKAGWEQLVDQVEQSVIRPGRGYSFSRNKGGTTFDINPGIPSTPSIIPGHPYKGYDASTGASPIVSIEYGTHNDVVPTIDSDEMAVDRSLNLVTLSENAKIVYAQLDLGDPWDQYPVNAASIHSSNSTSPPDSDEATAYQTLFAVEVTIASGVAQVAVAQNVMGSQIFRRCGPNDLYGRI